MGQFLKARSVANDVFPAICNVMAICNICKDERDSLFTVQSIYLLKSKTCLVEPFMEAYLRPSDKSSVVSEVFNICEKRVSRVSVVNTETTDQFLESLHFSDNGNLSLGLTISLFHYNECIARLLETAHLYTTECLYKSKI